MKRLSLLVFLLVFLVGCTSATKPGESTSSEENSTGNIPSNTVVKYDGYLDNFFNDCKADINSGKGTDSVILNDSQRKVTGFDFENNKELDESSTGIISTVKRSGKETQTISGTDIDYYYTMGTAKIAKYHNANKCVVVSNNLARNIYDERIAEDKPYYVSVADLNNDDTDEILVTSAYNKYQYQVHICKLLDGKTLEEIEFLDKQMLIKENDKTKLLDYLETNSSELSQWFKNVLKVTDEEYTGNISMRPYLVRIAGENCIALQFKDYYNYGLGQVIVTYGFEKESMILKNIYLCTD